LQELADNAELVFVTPKSKRSRRTVTFPARVAAGLTHAATLERDALVFRAAMGGPVRYRQWWRRIWKPTLMRAGLEGLRIHDLRHTHAAWLIAAGVPALAISRRLGHASSTVTMDLYGHLMPETDDAIIEALEGTLDRLAIDGGEISSRGNVGATRPDGDGATWSGMDIPAGQGGSRVPDLG